MINSRNRLTWDDYNSKSRNGAEDQRRTLERVRRENIPAYGLICVAEDPSATTRKIKGIRAEFLIRLQIEQEEGVIYGRHRGFVPLGTLVKEAEQSRGSPANGLADLGEIPPGSETPDRALAVSWAVVRDPAVRAHVLKQANGRCEHCGREGFRMRNGDAYLEAHHIISLSKDGRDTVENVIALCAEHHREAHYGATAEELEKSFVQCVQARNSAASNAYSPPS